MRNNQTTMPVALSSEMLANAALLLSKVQSKPVSALEVLSTVAHINTMPVFNTSIVRTRSNNVTMPF